MPYVKGAVVHGVTHVADVYHSNNVFVNFVEVALWNDPQGPEAAIQGQLLSPTFATDAVSIKVDDEQDPAAVEKNQRALIDGGLATAEEIAQGNTPKEGSKDTSTGSAVEVLSSSTTVDPSQTTFPDSYQLTTNYTLGSLTKTPKVLFGYQVQPHAGLSTAQIVENLQLLASNVIEPLKEYRSDMFVTNTFRTGSNTSQHGQGKAGDMQFSKASKADYFTIAQWIRSNLNFDQLLLEYQTTGSKLPWIHVSFNLSNNRRQILTLMNHKKHAVGLVDLSQT